jgi:hypothetical protein
LPPFVPVKAPDLGGRFPRLFTTLRTPCAERPGVLVGPRTAAIQGLPRRVEVLPDRIHEQETKSAR